MLPARRRLRVLRRIASAFDDLDRHRGILEQVEHEATTALKDALEGGLTPADVERFTGIRLADYLKDGQ